MPLRLTAMPSWFTWKLDFKKEMRWAYPVSEKCWMLETYLGHVSKYVLFLWSFLSSSVVQIVLYFCFKGTTEMQDSIVSWSASIGYYCAEYNNDQSCMTLAWAKAFQSDILESQTQVKSTERKSLPTNLTSQSRTVSHWNLADTFSWTETQYKIYSDVLYSCDGNNSIAFYILYS